MIYRKTRNEATIHDFKNNDAMNADAASKNDSKIDVKKSNQQAVKNVNDGESKIDKKYF